MPDRVIGLDIGSSSIKAAQVLRRGDGTFVVEKQAARPVPQGAIFDGRIAPAERFRISSALKTMMDEEKFSTSDTIVGLHSSSAVFMQEMLVPVMRPEDVAKAMPDIIASKSPELAATEAELAYTVLGEVEGDFGPELKVLVYSVRADYAREVGEVVEEAGLNLVGADLNPLATLRAVAIQDRPPHEIDAIVDIGSHITVMFLHHNGVPKMLNLDPDSAGAMATTRIADALGIDDADIHKAEWEKVNNEESQGLVAQARNTYSQGVAAKIGSGLKTYLDRSDEFSAIANLCLVGGGANIFGLGYFLRDELSEVPLMHALLDDSITAPGGGEVDTAENGSGGDYFVAIGLGTGERL